MKVAQGIQAPVLLIFGKQDSVIPVNKDGKVAIQCIPSAKFLALPCGHVAFAEAPELFLAEVLPFLSGCNYEFIDRTHHSS